MNAKSEILLQMEIRTDILLTAKLITEFQLPECAACTSMFCLHIFVCLHQLKNSLNPFIKTSQNFSSYCYGFYITQKLTPGFLMFSKGIEETSGLKCATRLEINTKIWCTRFQVIHRIMFKHILTIQIEMSTKNLSQKE